MYDIPKETLAKVLSGFRTLKLTRANLPVLQCLKLEVTAGTLRLTGTNLDDALICRLHSVRPAPEARPLLVPVEALREAVKTADGKSSVRVEPGRLTVTAGGTPLARTYRETPVSEFPYTGENAREAGEAQLPAETVASLLEAGAFASTDPTRFVLNGVHLTRSDIVATDGRRLYVKTLRGGERLGAAPEDGVILPTRAPLRLFRPDRAATLRLFREHDTGTSQGRIRFFALEQGAWTWSGKPVDGTYPNWRQVVPKDTAGRTAVAVHDEDAARLETVLPRLPGCEDKDAPIELHLEGRRVSLRTHERGEANTLPLEKSTPSGESARVRFNRGFLHEALKQGFRRMLIKDELSPVIMEDPGRNRMCLWMPLAPPHTAPRPAAQARSPAPAPAREKAPANGLARPNGAAPATDNHNRKPTTAMEKTTTQPTPPQRPGANGQHTQEDAAARVRDTLARLRELAREVNAAVQEIGTALRETERDKKALEKEHASLRRNLRGLKAIPI